MNNDGFGTHYYAAAPVDPSRLGAAMTAFDAAGGSAIRYAPEWMRKALEAASTPAAQGIDLEQFREAVHLYAHRMSHVCNAEGMKKADRLLALIDASPKGGIVDNVTRAAFQRWAVSQNLSVQRSEFHIGMAGDYVDRATSHAWEAWQAAMQATSAEVGECNCANGRAECMPDCASKQPTSHGAGVSE